MTIFKSKIFISLIAWVMLISGCGEQGSPSYTDSNSEENSTADTSHDAGATDEDSNAPTFTVNVALASDIRPEAPGTVGIVTWSLQDLRPDAAEIHFGLDTNYGMIAPVDLNEADFRTLLLGMKANRTYHFQVWAMKGERRYQSADYAIETGPLTNLVSLTSFIYDAESHASGFIVTSFPNYYAPSPIDEALVAGSPVFILDGDGEIVWWYQSKVGLSPRARMSFDGKSMWIIPERLDTYGAAVELVSMDTLTSTVYDTVDGAGHDGAVVDEDVLAYIDYGEGDCPSIFELHKDGAEKEIFESTEYLPGLVIPQCHLNAVRYNQAKMLYTVSDRDNEIFFMNRQGEVQMRLSEIVSNQIYGAEQHGHQLLSDSIILFANRGGIGGGSAVVEYSLTDGAELFRYDPGTYSPWYGDVQRLPGGNTLVTFSLAGTIHEVDPEGKLVMTIDGDIFGYAEWRASLYGKPSDI